MRTGTSQKMLSAILASFVLVGSVDRIHAAGGGPEPRNNERVPEVTFTKWVIGGGPEMAGFTGGDAVGDFTGEVLSFTWTQTSPFVAFVYSIEAVYDVHAGPHSFTALIKGGENAAGKAFLDGRVISGWLTGSPVHVTFQGKTDCAGAPPGPCFEGTIHIVSEAERD